MKDFQSERIGIRTEYEPAAIQVIEIDTQSMICQSQNGTLDNGMTHTPGSWEE